MRLLPPPPPPQSSRHFSPPPPPRHLLLLLRLSPSQCVLRTYIHRGRQAFAMRERIYERAESTPATGCNFPGALAGRMSFLLLLSPFSKTKFAFYAATSASLRRPPAFSRAECWGARWPLKKRRRRNVIASPFFPHSDGRTARISHCYTLRCLSSSKREGRCQPKHRRRQS